MKALIDTSVLIATPTGFKILKLYPIQLNEIN